MNGIMGPESVIDPETDSFTSDHETEEKSSVTTEETDSQKTVVPKTKEDLQKSEYDDFDDFDIAVDQLKDVKGFSDNKAMQRAMAGLASLNVGKNAASSAMSFEKSVKKQQKKIEAQMTNAPFWRKMDKASYVIGTMIIIGLTFFVGRYPHDHYYSFVTVLLPALLVPRYIQYFMQGYHYFLFDFCYLVNFLTLFFLLSGSKSQTLFVTIYLFGNGPVAVAIVAFRNSLVYHKIDYLTSLAIHAVPMITMTNIRWCTMQEQAHLPEDEQILQHRVARDHF